MHVVIGQKLYNLAAPLELVLYHYWWHWKVKNRRGAKRRGAEDEGSGDWRRGEAEVGLNVEFLVLSDIGGINGEGRELTTVQANDSETFYWVARTPPSISYVCEY